MYTFTKSFLGFIALLCMGLVGCKGPEGPAGPQGAPGPLALAYEVEFDLTSSNDYGIYYTFPTQDNIQPSDVALTYILTGQDNGVDIWKLMPAGDPFVEDAFIDFDFTYQDVFIYAYTVGQNLPSAMNDRVARIVVIPADFSPNARKALNIDYNDYNQVKKAFNLSDASVKKLTPVAKTKYEGPIIF
ncbi:hypothetical protein [Xanthocytophaga agilis]|uniref:Collagen-like protein n=1 Tax=Xanthocytophaga agilis TaxID=3048010 RepID=A0AAE3RD22_9BACT|nr:hypothetical protein [Xanthocytophaga agilis]MDJ1506352.1 hypothetical protein [Xanthocytophaga agilis]